MGCTEIHCQLCGVSFNISRFRKAGEAVEAAWRNTGDGVKSFVSHFEDLAEARCVRKGCYFVCRKGEKIVPAADGSEDHWPPPTSRYASADFDPDDDDECEEPERNNCFFAVESEGIQGMPFHPTCLEIFKKISIHRYSALDMEGFVSWYQLIVTHEKFYNFPRNSDVGFADEQWWLHLLGAEYFAANPCFVPELQSIVAQTHLDNLSRTQSRIGEDGGDSSNAAGDLSKDMFLRLPPEIKYEIVFLLSLTDASNLCHASRAFKELPQSLFYDQVLHEMPWFYEAWSDLTYSHWATTTAQALKKRQVPTQSVTVQPVSRNGTNWQSLGGILERAQITVPGLRNRARIWRDCQEILNMIDTYRGEGKISPREQ